MTKGGFAVKIGKKVIRCFAVSFDHDEWSYAINNKDKKPLPKKIKKITIEVK